MIRILKASAGSGKTFALTRTYLELLFREGDPRAFRHILAVTFTNKATAEMKGRILKELSKLSKDPRKSPYYKDFVPSLFPADAALKKAAQDCLMAILHDYSSFSVSTIDRFFQQTLRAFAREIGQFAPYQIALDKKPLIHEAVDTVLDSVTENDRELLSWLDEKVSSALAAGEKPRLESSLYEMAEKLGKFDVDRSELTRSSLSSVRSDCEKIAASFRSRLEEYAPEYCVDLDPGKPVPYPKITVYRKLPDRARQLFDEEFDKYNTAEIILSQIWSLGIAQEFFSAFDGMLQEKNIMCLDDSNSLLRRIIEDCDTPFIYEKTGVRYEHFLLDEFQDTSTVQWNNFRPLLTESESYGRDSLVVGDVKQSIYRWRGSDWRLLGGTIQKQFGNVQEQTLRDNWRSAPAVVDFNGDFFRYAAAALGEDASYGDVCQTPRSDLGQKGSVKVYFVGKNEQDQCILDSIASVRGRGASWSDITILVRNNDHGARVASLLIENGIPVITDDSLKVKSSKLVRRLTALLECMEKPDNAIAAFSAKTLGISLPNHFHSLVELAETLLGELVRRFPEDARAEVLHIESFMDALQDWTTLEGNNLLGFLRYWKETDINISSPPGSDSVRVMTIHKSKGLEFRHVIFPYAEKVDLFGGSLRWCRPSPAISLSADRHYPVSLSGSMERSFFRDDLHQEQEMQRLDNLNIFYVALTRAVCSMDIIAATPSQDCIKHAEKNNLEGMEFKNISQILYFYCRTHGHSFGEDYDFTADTKEKAEAKSLDCEYKSYPLCEGLKVRREEKEDDDPRREGTVLHAIFSRVNVPEDVAPAVQDAFERGDLSREDAARTRALLSSAVAAHPSWFPAGGASIHNEVSIFDGDGSVHRPDRVVSDGNSVTVIDYKFGQVESPKYLSQVRKYVELYKSLGYSDVKGYVWYVREKSYICISDGQRKYDTGI